MTEDQLYFIEAGDAEKLAQLSKQLMGGNDRERDYGHKLWLIVGNIQPATFPTTNPKR